MKEISWLDDDEIKEEEEEKEQAYSIHLMFPEGKVPFNHFCRKLEMDDKILKFSFRDKKFIVPLSSVQYISIEEENCY